MARVNSALWAPLATGAEPTSTSSTGPTDVKTITVPANARGVWLTCEGAASARVTFGGVDPGNATGPGQLVVTGTAASFFPLEIRSLRFASSGAGTSTLTPLFVN